MCPGGVSVPSASAPGEVVINGMSAAGRNSPWSNAAIVVEVRPEDTGGDGLAFREELEKTAYREANGTAGTTGQRAPAQRLMDFLAGRLSRDLPPSSYAPGLVSSRLDQWLPPFMARSLQAAFPEFEKRMHGLICPDALLVAPETRTSTPVRIVRNAETFQSPAISGLFPAGEGSGYAGGIVSSALDGENTAAALIAQGVV
jgi:uncharacterized FAD-dependent dehydrogenase